MLTTNRNDGTLARGSVRARAKKRVKRDPQRGRGLKRCLVLLHLLTVASRPMTLERITERLNAETVEEWSARTIKRDLAAMRDLNLVHVHRGVGYSIVRDQTMDCFG